MSTIRSEGRREGEKGKETGEVSANNWCPIQKALNALEAAKKSTTVYKVRGTPKNGLFLKKFMTRRETTEVSDH